jgi:mRNA-degrading endonuclease toxin of MazEF toxin-antitoxin module
MPKLQPKEIWKVALSDSQAHEQMGDRPAIVIVVHQETGMTMVVPFTKNQDYTRFPYTYLVKKSNTNGLILDSVALVFQMRCLGNSTSRFLYKMGTIEDAHLKQIKILIKDYLGIVE